MDLWLWAPVTGTYPCHWSSIFTDEEAIVIACRCTDWR